MRTMMHNISFCLLQTVWGRRVDVMIYRAIPRSGIALYIITVDIQLPITNYQMAMSKQGAGGGSATHKEPT